MILSLSTRDKKYQIQKYQRQECRRQECRRQEYQRQKLPAGIETRKPSRKEGNRVEILTHSEAETEALGIRLAHVLDHGAVVAFRGGLGMGKTAFIRGLARGLGYTGRVTSPTFTIVNEYEGGRLPLFHFDLYRLPDSAALFDIGWEDYLDRGGVCAVEWSEQAEEAIPPDCVRVSLFPAGIPDYNRNMEISNSDSNNCNNSSSNNREANNDNYLNSAGENVRRIVIEGADLP